MMGLTVNALSIFMKYKALNVRTKYHHKKNKNQMLICMSR